MLNILSNVKIIPVLIFIISLNFGGCSSFHIQNTKVLELIRMGKYSEALPQARQVLEIAEKNHGPDHSNVAASLNNLALLYFHLGDYGQAESFYRRSLTISEKALGPDHPDVAQSLSNLALLYDTMGDYDQAEPLHQRSLKIREKSLGPDHPNVAQSLNNLATQYFHKGDYSRAESLFQRSLKIWEKTLGPDHPDVATSLNNLALLYDTIGDYDQAEPLYQRSLRISEKALGLDHPEVALPLNNLALLYAKMGDYGQAEPLLQRSLRIWEKALGPDHPKVATSFNNLAFLYVNMGDYGQAEALYQRSLKSNEKTLGPDHPNVAQSLNNLADLYIDMGDYGQAEPLFQRSLRIWEKALGPDHPDVAKSLNNLAVLYEFMGDYGKAEPLLQRSLKIWEKTLGPDHPNVAQSHHNLAGLFEKMGDYVQAESLFQRSLKIVEKALGSSHPDVAKSLISLAWLEAKRGDFTLALEYFKEALPKEDIQIQNVFSIATEQQKLGFIELKRRNFLIALSLIRQRFANDPDALRWGLELILRRKGVVFDAQSRVHSAIREQLSGEAREDWERLTTARRKFSQLLLNKPANMKTKQYTDALSSLQKQIEEAEKRLASQSALVNRELKQRKVTVKALASKLPKDAVLIEFIRIRDYDFSKREYMADRYLAFVLLPNEAISLVDLGSADKLEKQARLLIKEIRAPVQLPNESNENVLEASLQLQTSLWKPLERIIGKARKIFFSPDGILNLTPLTALMLEDGQFLVEKYQVAYLTTGRDLVGLTDNIPDNQIALFLAANPEYGHQLSTSNTKGSAVRSRDFRGKFAPLPGTQVEAEKIPDFIMGEERLKTVVTGTHATEAAVREVKSPRILHLATHGFFLNDVKITSPENSRGMSIISLAEESPGKPYENPLVRSGLAFAGANHAGEVTEGDDGLLTALEISGMNLYGTYLVVLSACETGVGDIKNGEGVFGLRRAFALAGAKNLMMSLWPVSDAITANQMIAFYKNLQTRAPADALREAQLETIKDLRAKYGHAPVSLWAPFILQGADAFGN